MAQGITGVGRFAQLGWTARGLVPELSFLQGAARVYWMQVFGTDVPFYDQASLGGEDLFRGFQEDRFIDMGAWEVEAEQRVTLFRPTFLVWWPTGASIRSFRWVKSMATGRRPGRTCAPRGEPVCVP